jgi:hypothetical protein
MTMSQGDSTMSRTEIFALFAGIIGFIADILTIGTFVASWMGEPQYGQPQISAPVATLVSFSLVYSWLIISWFLTHRSYLLWEERHVWQKEATYSEKIWYLSHVFTKYLVGCVYGIAIPFSPLCFFWLRLWVFVPRAETFVIILITVFIEAVLGFVICLALAYVHGDLVEKVGQMMPSVGIGPGAYAK